MAIPRFFRKPWILLPVLFIIGFVYARSTGITGRTKLSSTPGCTCHGADPSGTVSVQISGPDTLAPGQTASYQVTISGGPLSAAGTNIASTAGTLQTSDGSLQKLSGELTHSAPKSPSAGSVVFNFSFTAPQQEGPVTLAANGNSVDLSGSNSGDQWNFAPNFIVNVRTPSGLETPWPLTARSFNLGQNFPNPFNPSTQIPFTLQSSRQVNLYVYTVQGELVRTLHLGRMAAGRHQVQFRAGDLPSGTYLYRLQVGNRQETRRMVLLR